MVGASLVQTSFGKVKISDLKIVDANGRNLNAKIFIPKDASADNKLPLVVVQHGSQHNLEMQDMNYVELSRRGYIVISCDAYRHSSSDPGEGMTRDEAFTDMIAMVEYAYNLDIVDKDKIGITGHSMGAAITTTTLKYYVEQEARGLGPNKIAATLEVGYDPEYVPYQFDGVADPVYADVDWGVIAGKYDEYFFRQEDVGNDPARILESAAARAFINQADPSLTGNVENGKIYKGTINGKECMRVFYQNPEIHPQNVFSYNTSRCVTEFFYQSLGTPSGHAYIDPTNQVWEWKQFFNCIGLIAMFMFLCPFACWIMNSVPYFGVLKKKKEVPAAPALDNGKKKVAFWITYAINLIIPAALAMPVMHYWIGKQSFAPVTANRWFGDGAVNEMAGWSVVVSICLLAVFAANYWFFGRKNGATTESWGFKITKTELWRSFLLAVLTFTVCCGILFFADYWFKTDFRIWLIALRVFTPNKVMYIIAYVPAFALFYLVNSLLVNGGNRVSGMPDWVVTLISCIANVAGVAVLIFIQYFNYSRTGTFIFNAMRTHNLFPLLVIVPTATIVTRKYFRETGNIYLGSFTVSMLITIMTITQTTMTYTLF